MPRPFPLRCDVELLNQRCHAEPQLATDRADGHLQISDAPATVPAGASLSARLAICVPLPCLERMALRGAGMAINDQNNEFVRLVQALLCVASGGAPRRTFMLIEQRARNSG